MFLKFVIVGLSFFPVATTQTSFDCSVVNNLLAALNGSNLINITDCCAATGNGVTCDNSGRVIQLDWSYQSLNGFLTEDINYLDQLTFLDISHNNIAGLLPKSLANLTNLSTLYINANNFTSAFFNPALTPGFANLQYCNLTENDNLCVDYMNILPNPCSGQLPNCTDCQIASYVWQMFQGPSMAVSAPYNCCGNTFPAACENISGMDRVVTMQWVNLNLSGVIPASLGAMDQLVTLLLDYNEIGGIIPEALCNLDNLHYLTMSDNNIMGFIPSCLGNLTELRFLWLSSNHLVGTLPPSLASLQNIVYFLIDDNLLWGNIPDFVSNWTNLVNLNVSHNYFSGPLPTATAPLINVTTMSYSNNYLSGPIDGDVYNTSYPALTYCNLTGNEPDLCVMGGTAMPLVSTTLYQCGPSFYYYYDVYGFVLNATNGSLPANQFDDVQANVTRWCSYMDFMYRTIDSTNIDPYFQYTYQINATQNACNISVILSNATCRGYRQAYWYIANYTIGVPSIMKDSVNMACKQFNSTLIEIINGTTPTASTASASPTTYPMKPFPNPFANVANTTCGFGCYLYYAFSF